VKAADRKEAGKRKTKAGASNRGQKKGQGALKAGSAFKKSNSASKVGRTAPSGQTNVKDGGGTHFRSESSIKRINMYKSKPNLQKMREQPNKPVRIQPDRRWFGNTRVIAQDKMQAFRETLSKGVEDPFSVVLKSSKLPMSLLRDTEGKASRMNLLSVEPFNEVFGKRRRQKRVKLGSYDLEELLQSADKKAENYSEEKDVQSQMDLSSGLEKSAGEVAHAGEEIFNKGTSRRIWAELYKVVDASDVLVFVLDARDPMGTRCQALERELRQTRPNKHIVLLLNKVDLVPTWVSRKWIQVLMKDFPTLAFHASITNPFGKNALLNLLRQFGNLLKEAKHVTIGMVGYPNVGKSSVINTLRRKKVCKAAPVPGETKVWQYITLTKKIYMLDCPGIVPPTQSDFSADAAKVLKGVVRAERIQNPSDYIDEVLSRVKNQYLLQRYKLPQETTWDDAAEFLSILGTKMGKLHKGGEPDLEIAARIVLYDWQRGRIPFFTPPPEDEAKVAASSSAAPAPEGDAQVAAEAAPKEGDEAAPSSAGDAQNAEASDALRGPVLQQSLASLSEITCALEFDEEDRRGEAVLSAEALQPGLAGSKRKEAGEATEVGGGGGARKAKRRRQTSAAQGAGVKSGERAAMKLKEGSVDWKAVVSEFGM